MMHKKGQGAMEYLMTYGWAILVVIIVGVVLWQMGVFTPGAATAASFSGFGPLKPVEWACSTGTGSVTAVMTNGAGGTVTNVDVTAGASATNGTCTPVNVTAGDTTTCIVAGVTECSSVAAGDRYEVNVDVVYTSPTGISRTSSGDIWGPSET